MNDPSVPRKKLALIDGSGYIFRAFYALPPFTNSEGTPVGAVYGFSNMLAKFLDGHIFDHLAVVFDTARRNYRHDIFPDYKAHRAETPPELIPQFPLIRDACKAFNVVTLEMDGYEADDLMATYARRGVEAHYDVTLVTSDKDFMQLMTPHIHLWDPIKNKPLDESDVMTKFGVLPEKVVDVQSLMGDKVDNVPGVPSIGPKTASELIGLFGTLENLLENIDQIKQPARRQALETHKEMALLSKKLVTLTDTVPLEVPLDDLASKNPDPVDLGAFLKLHNFTALYNRLHKKNFIVNGSSSSDGISVVDGSSPTGRILDGILETPSLETPYKPYHLIQEEVVLKEWMERAVQEGCVALDTETTSLDATQADLVGFSLAFENGDACYVPLQHKINPKDIDLFSAKNAVIRQIPLGVGLGYLKSLGENPAILKIGHNIKYDMLVLKKYGVDIISYDDTMVISYVLSAGLHGQGMDELAQKYLGLETIKFKDVAGSGQGQVTFDYVPLDKARDYAAQDADVTMRLWQTLKPRLTLGKLVDLYESLERKLIPVLVDMEVLGIKVDPARLMNMSKTLEKQIHVLEGQIYALTQETFNVASPKQLGKILFETLGLPGAKKSKTGAWQTDSSVLEELVAQGHQMPEKVLEWRQLSKLKNTYCESLLAQINPKTGRVHTSYAMAVTSTGRLSSTDPNLQNIPVRTAIGREIRQCFIPQEGCVFVSLDYSQIELRLLAHMAQSDTMREVFLRGEDIHTQTAAQMFGVLPSEVTSDLRRQAKTINFGIIYGLSAFGLSRQLKIPQKEAQAFIAAYFDHFPEIKGYIESMKTIARQKGYVETLFKRRCYVPTINDKNPTLRGYAERQAINAPLQGSNADIIKDSMIQIASGLKLSHLKAQMILQVHDELIFEVPTAEVDALLAMVRPLMENVVSLSVPLLVDFKVGSSWGNLE